jgi:uncharacterized protein (TIGR03086 family)
MTVDVSVLVPTGAEETHAWLTEPARLRRWQYVAGRADLRVGGEFRWLIAPGHTATGAYTAVGPGRVSRTWAWEGDDAAPSTVDVTIEPAAQGSKVRLVHEGLTDEQARAHAEGWTHYLERLVTVTTTGDAGPDEYAVLGDEPTTLTAAETSLAICLQVLRAMGDNHGADQTPCSKFTVDDLLGHLLGSLTSLAGMAGRPFDAVDGTPEERVADAAFRSIEAWRARGLAGVVPGPSGDLPAELASSILSVELLVHAWDFAVAAGMKFAAAEELSSYVLELSHRLIAPELRDGERFAAEIEIGPNADAIDRLVAFTGRAA